MVSVKVDRSIGIWVVTIVATLFGLLTIKSGGSVLFLDGIARENAGNYVPFVLWFNFIAGFAYILVGIGLFIQKHWAIWLSIFIAVTTLIVFIFFGLHIFNEGLYEVRTVVAMSLRTVIWIVIAVFTYHKMAANKGCPGPDRTFQSTNRSTNR